MESDQSHRLSNAWPFVAIVLLASGILVRTVPLESKRPTDPDRVRVYHTGRQDVDARLWQDPFVVMHHIKSDRPIKRCQEAIDDWAHHPSILGRTIAHKNKRNRRVTVIPVMVPGGPYFEDREGRRRARYAVVTALLNSGWKPSDEDKIGYVWTFESCVIEHWERRVPELLPYEWFALTPQSEKDGEKNKGQDILVLWVDEDVISRRPLEGMNTIIERFVQQTDIECPPTSDNISRVSIYGDDEREKLKEKLEKKCKLKTTEWWQTPGYLLSASKKDLESRHFRTSQELQYDIHIIGLSTSRSLVGFARDLQRSLQRDFEEDLVKNLLQQDTTPALEINLGATLDKQATEHDLHFYSSGAMTPEIALGLKKILEDPWSNYASNIDRRVTNPGFETMLFTFLGSSGDQVGLEALSTAFHDRVVRLTETDSEFTKAFNKKLSTVFHDRVVRLTETSGDKLTEALVKELQQRLTDATPFSRIHLLNPHGKPLCGDTVVVISEGDTHYLQFFREFFQKYFSKDKKDNFYCAEGSWPLLVPVYYLRGLDGVLPEGTGASVQSTSPSSKQARTTTDVVFEQTALERADGASQYDYLRRLAEYLVDLDRREKQAGRNGVRAVGVLGNDLYDKFLVLDALRNRFPKALFFTTDLDARLLGREVIHSTRNLIVASLYGLTLHPGIQEAAPPFRDTYQSGMYLSTLVALDSVLRRSPPIHSSSWFETPQLFEIGRTRAVPLSKGSNGECKRLELEHCTNIHALDEWAGFNLWPTPALVMTLAIIVVTGTLGLFPLCRHAYGAIRNIVLKMVAAVLQRGYDHRVVITMAVGIVTAMLLAVVVVCGISWFDMTSGKGEPFAWFEGVSIWPTLILELLVLIGTFILLFYGRCQLTQNIDTVAEEFSLTPFSKRTSATMRRVKSECGFWPRLTWRWGLDWLAMDSPGIGTTNDPWLDFLDQMQFRPTFARVLKMTALFFIFGIALLSLEWPLSPHRGMVSAWFNHVLLLLLLVSMMALLCMAIDASDRTRRYFRYLDPNSRSEPDWKEPAGQRGWTQYPIDTDTIRLWTRFRFAVRLASSVNQFIYLPLIILLLVLPTRSRVFDAWDIPLAYVALLGISFVLAVRAAFALRRAAAELKTQTLKHLTRQVEELELIQYSRSGNRDAIQAPDANPDGQPTGLDHEDTPAPGNISFRIKATWLRRIAKEIRSEQAGPFRPFTQEPVVQAMLILSGWAGGLSTIEFLFLK